MFWTLIYFAMSTTIMSMFLKDRPCDLNFVHGCILGAVLLKVNDVIENGANDTEAIVNAVEAVRNATAIVSISGDLNAATRTLLSLANSRAGVENAVVSSREILVKHCDIFFSKMVVLVSFVTVI